MRMRITPKALHRRLQQLARQSNPVNLTGCMKHVGMAVRRDIVRALDNQRSPQIIGPSYVQDKAGQPFARLAPSTTHGRIQRGKGRKRRKRRMGLKAAERQAARMGREKALIDSGDMRKRITYTVTHGRGGVIVRIGSSVHYSKYHQTGFRDRGGGRVAARPFVGANHGTLLACRTRILKRITKR